MSEILVKCGTRHRDTLSKYYLKDWTAFDVVSVKPDGYYTKNKHRGAKAWSVVLLVEGDISFDYCSFDSRYDDVELYGRSKHIVDLTKHLEDAKVKDCFNHDLLVDPIKINKSYLDLFIDRSERTEVHRYDEGASFDNQTVDVGPGGHVDANDFQEFEGNVAISVGAVIGNCDEAFQESTTGITALGTGAVSGKELTFKCTGAALHAGKWDTASSYYTDSSGTYGWITRDPYVNLEGIQMTGGSGLRIREDNLDIDSCIIRSTTGDGLQNSDSNCNDVRIWNSIIYDPAFDQPAGSEGLIWDSTDGDITLYNCLFAGYTSGIEQDGGTITATNCLSFLNDDDFTGTIATSYCGSDDNDNGGTGDFALDATSNYGDEFTDQPNGDFSIKDSGSAQYEAGNGATAKALFTDDIKGVERSGVDLDWDSGPFEYVAAGGGLSIPIAMHHFRQQRLRG